MATISTERARELFGDPDEIVARLNTFRESARVFSSDQPRLIALYPEQWVAVVDGEVIAHSTSFETLMRQIEASGTPSQHVMVRFIDTNPGALIV